MVGDFLSPGFHAFQFCHFRQPGYISVPAKWAEIGNRHTGHTDTLTHKWVTDQKPFFWLTSVTYVFTVWLPRVPRNIIRQLPFYKEKKRKPLCVVNTTLWLQIKIFMFHLSAWANMLLCLRRKTWRRSPLPHVSRKAVFSVYRSFQPLCWRNYWRKHFSLSYPAYFFNDLWFFLPGEGNSDPTSPNWTSIKVRLRQWCQSQAGYISVKGEMKVSP